MKNYKRNTIILVVVSLLVIYISLKDDFNNVMKEVLSVNLGWFAVAMLLMVVVYALSGYTLYLMVKPFKKDYKLIDALKLRMIVQFFNAITPFAAGGQAVQIYLLNKNDKVDTPTGTTIIVQSFILNQIALLIFLTSAVITNYYTKILSNVTILKNIVILIYVLTILIITSLFILSFARKANKFVTRKLIKLFALRKSKKEKAIIINKWNEFIDRFHNSALYFRKNKMFFLKLVGITLITFFLTYSVALILMYSLGDYISLNTVNTLVASIYTLSISGFVPLPGAAGGSEYTFTMFFGELVNPSKVIPLMLLWRFITYYFGLLLGAIMLIISKNKEETK